MLNNSDFIMEALKEINLLMENGLKKYFAANALTIPQLGLVNILSHYEPVKINEISERLKVSPSAVSGILDRLEAQGLVERSRSKDDRRVVYVRLTSKFKTTHENLENNINQYLELLLKPRSQEEIDKIAEGLQLLKKILLADDEVLTKHVNSGFLPGDDASC